MWQPTVDGSEIPNNHRLDVFSTLYIHGMVPISTGARPSPHRPLPRGPSVLCIPSPRIDVTWRNPLVTLGMHFLWGKIFRTCWANVVVEFQPNWNIYANVKLKHFPQLFGWTFRKSLKPSPSWEVVVVCHMCFFKERLSPLQSIYVFFLDLCWKSCRNLMTLIDLDILFFGELQTFDDSEGKVYFWWEGMYKTL